MANMCLYEPINGSNPNCDGACKKGKDNYCQYYFVNEICAIVKQWKKEAHVEEPLLIKYDYNRKKMIIYTTRPGWLVGFHGNIIDKYSKLLNEKLILRFTTADGIPQNGDFIELVECNDAVI